jgi:hypothetical protein
MGEGKVMRIPENGWRGVPLTGKRRRNGLRQDDGVRREGQWGESQMGPRVEAVQWVEAPMGDGGEKS